MPRNEDGEFELVLGNRQLLSVFFIVVVLLGVFFTMGYIVGRNSAPGGGDLAKKTEPIVVDKPSDAKPEPSRPLAPGQAEVTTPAAAQAVSEPKPSPAVEEAKKPVEEKAAMTEPPKPEPNRETTRPSAPSTASVMEPPKGTTYLQVMAVARSDAEMFVNVLRKKGFPATIASSANTELFRVLVGPLEPTSVAKTKAELAEAGFKGAIVKRY